MGTFVSERKLVNEDLKNYQELESSKNIIACLIGGDGRSSKLEVSEISGLVDKINLISERYTVVYCFSRRTSAITKKIIKKRKN